MHTAQSGSSLIVAGTRPSAARWQRYVRLDQLYRQARVVGLARQTDDAVSLTLAPMDGQPCEALAGQYLTLIAEIDGRRVKRAYSLSESADGKTFTITCKEIRNGEMSFHINRHLKEGDLLQFAGPSGDFVVPDPAPAHSVFVAAGSGITPVMAMLEQLLEHDRCGLPITLVYGNRREKDILFRSRLDALAQRHPQLSIRYVLSKPTKRWQGERGRVVAGMLPVLSAGHYFLCGPDSFNNDLRDGLLQRGIAPTAISVEHFTRSTGESRPHPTEPHPVLFRLPDGSEQEVTVRPGESILEAGLRGSVPLQFSCTMGGCGHCKITVESGDVATDEPNCLSESERQAGQSLACCARPHGRVVVQVPEAVL